MALTLVACGGKSDSDGSATPPSNAGPAGALQMASLALAQTHVLPEAGLAWSAPTPPNASERLHLVGRRGTLVLVRLSAADAQAPVIEGLRNGNSLGTVPLAAPAQLPATEGGGPAYGSGLHSAMLPEAWVLPGLQLRVRAANYQPGATRSPTIGADMPMTVRVLPFYLFGANDTNSGIPLSQIAAPPAAAAAEMLSKWPVSALDIGNHPAGRVSWASVVIAPRNDSSGTAQPAYVVAAADQQKEGYAVMDSVLNVLMRMRTANGEGPLAVQHYAPLVMLGSNGRYVSPGGGLGNSDSGTGDHTYTGVFIHEQGHAFGMPHQGEAYDAGRYPYSWGSLNGSAWGFDTRTQEFLPPFMAATSERYSGCTTHTFAGHARTVDASNRCVKQDPMQSGGGDQALGYRYGTFSDYSTAMMQRHLEGVTTTGTAGAHVYSGGKLVRDAAFPSGYKRWDGLDATWVNADIATTEGAIYGFDRGLPLQRDVKVHAIAVTLSNAGTAGATQIYPPISYTGNLLQGIDPTSPADRALITSDTGTYYFYCRNGGCDYTLRVTYSDGSTRHLLLQGGFRPFNQARGTPAASASNPLSGDSFKTWVVNVPGTLAVQKLELLSTPQVWSGMPATPAVLAERVL
jgi:hypothetical protein